MPLGSQDERDRQRFFEREEQALDDMRREDAEREKACRVDEMLELQEWVCPTSR
jgi:hypothetical protein